MEGIRERMGEASARAVLFSGLAHAFNYPDRELALSLAEGTFQKQLTDVLSGDAKDIISTLNIYTSSDVDQLLLDLEKDYTWMFLASKPRIAYLFGSVYSEGKLYQESTFEIARLYNDAGLKLDESFRLPPDHIAVELECFAYLAFNEKEAIQAGNAKNEEYALELQKKMAENYLGPLAFNVGQRIGEQARTDFYKIIGKLLKTLFPGLNS